jgi:hypothetical protein
VGVNFTDSGTYAINASPSLFSDFLLALSSTQTVTVTGLVPNSSYQLYLYGQNGGDNDRGASFSITTGSGSPEPGSNAYTVNAANGNTFVENANYVVFNVTTNSSGAVAISWSAPPSAIESPNEEGDFNGIQIVKTNPSIDINFSGSSDTITSPGAYTGDNIVSPTWNNVTANTSSLLKSDGTPATGVGVHLTDSGTYAISNTPSLLSDFLLALGSSTQTATITGLTPSNTYQFYLYGQNGGDNDRGATFSITTGTGSPASGSSAAAVNVANNGDAFVENANYVIFNVTPNSSGTVGISWSEPPTALVSPNTEGDFNGIQIINTTP